jgi:hypothetical protein
LGLFDTITCEYPLPVAEHQNLEFQTKDLESLLDHYTITRDGRLVRRAGHGLWGSRGGPARDVTWPLHGDLRFYTSTGEGEARQWIEYVARFTHGRVEWIRDHAEAATAEGEAAPDAPAPQEEDRASPAPQAGEALLQENLRRRAAELDVLLESCSDHWGFEDPVYRFYHQSFKVYALQEKTREIVRVLTELVPDRPLHRWFRDLVAAGTGKEFDPQHNADWTAVTRPILEAFFHARYFLEMAVRYAYLKEPPNPLPSGYAALLELYGLR